jgi:hypothetical protein
MYKKVAAKGTGSIVIDATSTICHIAHNQRFHLTESKHVVGVGISKIILLIEIMPYISRISAMIQANISNPSGSWRATIVNRMLFIL